MENFDFPHKIICCGAPLRFALFRRPIGMYSEAFRHHRVGYLLCGEPYVWNWCLNLLFEKAPLAYEELEHFRVPFSP